MKQQIDFTKLAYLKRGNKKQQQAYKVLNSEKVLEKLRAYDPLLVGTIPIEIDIDNSDLDIICCFKDKAQFENALVAHFRSKTDFLLWHNNTLKPHAIVSSFKIDKFEVEIFGQGIPTQEQNAYRHMLIEHFLLKEKGEVFRQRIIEHKKLGYKTEPAFALELGLSGDPYDALLKYDFENK